MSKIFKLSNTGVEVAAGVKIIRGSDLEDLMTANELFRRLEERKKAAEEEAERIFKERYDEGFRQGSEEGREEYELKILDAAMTSLDSLESLEKQLTEVVISSVRSVIGGFDDVSLAQGIVSRALQSVRGEKRVTVRVGVSVADGVRSAFESALLSPDGRSGYLEIIADASLKSGDCIIETPQGVIDASLDTQLGILEKALRDRAGHRDD